MKKIITIYAILSLCLLSANVFANTTESSTIWFGNEGDGTNYLNDGGSGGSYLQGTIAAHPGYYYIPGGPGENAADGGNGGFDVYAKNGATAYVSGYSPTTHTISDHDAYNEGDGWGTFYDPDCADWDNYQLTVTENTWALEYNGGTLGNAIANPMSGTLQWISVSKTSDGIWTGTAIATETGTGAYYGSQTPMYDGSSGMAAAQNGGGAGAWDMDWTWGSEAIPLETATFQLTVSQHNSIAWQEVSLKPIPAPGAVLLGGIGVGLVGWFKRRKTV